MTKFLSINQAATLLGVSPQTLRRWEKSGKLVPTLRTRGNQRRYDPAGFFQARSSRVSQRPTIAYARVSSHDQKEDLQRQREMLEMYCASQGWSFEVIADLGSGMNYQKKGLKKLLEMILDGECGRLVLTHKDRLLRFGAELIFSLCEARGIEVVLINQGDEPTFEEELAKDVLEIITVFSSRLYGARSHKSKKLMHNLKKAVESV